MEKGKKDRLPTRTSPPYSGPQLPTARIHLLPGGLLQALLPLTHAPLPPPHSMPGPRPWPPLVLGPAWLLLQVLVLLWVLVVVLLLLQRALPPGPCPAG